MTEEGLDTVLRNKVKELFPGKCNGLCNPNKFYSKSELEAAHYIKRGNKSTRWLISNILPACITCNRFNPGHIEKLAENIDKIYGEGTAEEVESIGRRSCKLSAIDRSRIAWYLSNLTPDNVYMAHREMLNLFILPNLI